MPCKTSGPRAPTAELFTVGEVAQVLNVCVRTVWTLAKRELRPVRVRGCTRWRRQDVAAYISQLAQKQSAAEGSNE